MIASSDDGAGLASGRSSVGGGSGGFVVAGASSDESSGDEMQATDEYTLKQLRTLQEQVRHSLCTVLLSIVCVRIF